MKFSHGQPNDELHRWALALLWITLVLHVLSGALGLAPYAASTLGVLGSILLWIHWNRSLGLVGSALVGALILSSSLDCFFAYGFKSDSASGSSIFWMFLAPLWGIIVGFWILLFSRFWVTVRWFVFGLVSMFLLRALLTAPSHHAWSNRLTDEFVGLLGRAGLRVEIPGSSDLSSEFPRISQQEMPCGMMNYSVPTHLLKSETSKVQLYVKECGFHPQGFSLSPGVFSLEIHNALPRALELRLSVRTDEGNYLPPRSFVVPPESHIEVGDLEGPQRGALIIYAPLEPSLGSALFADPSLGAEWRVSREPLRLERQFLNAP